MKSLFGFNENIVAAFSYLLGPISGLPILIFERENKFVRFHALQSTLWFLFLWVVHWGVGLLSSIPFLGIIIGLIAIPVMWVWRMLFVSSKIFLILRALLHHEFKLPYVGDVAWNQVHK